MRVAGNRESGIGNREQPNFFHSSSRRMPGSISPAMHYRDKAEDCFGYTLDPGMRRDDGSFLSHQEILQQCMSMLGQDRLGMELHAFHGKLLVAQPHDFLEGTVFVFCPSGDFK